MGTEVPIGLRGYWQRNRVKQAMEFACPLCGETAVGLMTPTGNDLVRNGSES